MLVRNPDRSAVTLSEVVERYFQLALYLMVVSGFATLASTGELDLPTLLVIGSAISYRGYLLAANKVFTLPQVWVTSLTLIFSAFFLFDFLVLSGSFVTATVHYVLLLMVVRLLSAKRSRDYVFLALLSFLLVLAAAVLTVNSTFLLLFAVFMLAAIFTFILLEMRRSSEAAHVHGAEPSPAMQRRMALSLFGASPLMLLLIVTGGTAIFFVLPRLSGGYLNAYARPGELSSGFSNRVELGLIGQIQQSNAIAMHIQILGDHTGAYDLKWRGIALNHFDGKIWSNTLEQRPARRLNAAKFSLSRNSLPWEVLQEKASLPISASIHYRVLLEPIGTNVFFLAPEPEMLQGNYLRVGVDRGGAVYNLDDQHPTARYEAESQIPDVVPALLRAASGSISPEIQRTYLQLPGNLDARVPELARRITAGLTTEFDRVSAVERYLSNNYGYTLELGTAAPKDPVAYFLFERKQGHCEYFASSMTVLLRSIGIPSRVVNGFRTGEFNDINSQYVVRARNAHSWVEAYFPDYGWVSFDPTPAAPFATHPGWSRAVLYLDAMQAFWREWVVNYDFTHQRALGQEATQTSRHIVERTSDWGRHTYALLTAYARQIRMRIKSAHRAWITGVLLAGVLVFLIARMPRILRLMRSSRIAAHPERAPQEAATIWYARMTGAVARRGWRKSVAQTPTEFVGTIDQPELRVRVQDFTRCYESARFGASAHDAQELPRLYEEISSTAE